MVAQMIFRGAPPQQTSTQTGNMASVQVNVRLVNYSISETRENMCFGALKSPSCTCPPDSSLHNWRKRQWREMCLPLHIFGQGVWQLHHRGPHRWSSLVCHHLKLRPGQEIWLLSQKRCVAEKRMNNCNRALQSLFVLTDVCDLEQIRLLAVGIQMERPVTSPSCSVAKSTIRAPVRAEKMGSCGAVPLPAMTRTRNGACVLTRVRKASEQIKSYKCVLHCY